MHRTTRRLSLTEDGTAFYERAKSILRDVENAAAELSARRGLVAGPLRISAPVGFGSLHLGPALFGFLRENPGIELTLELDDRFVNLFITLHPNAVMRVNNGVLTRDAAIAGLGIALLPAFFLNESLQKRTLRVIDIGAEAQGATIYIAYPEHLRSSGKIRALAAWLQKSFSPDVSVTQQV
jgi:DNA-binding transcriptional LysR family regulator